MKKWILPLAVLMTMTSAPAAEYGTPDEDPIVKDIRQHFSESTRPSYDQLYGHSYRCKEFDARPGNFDRRDFTSLLSFSKVDGYLQSRFPDTNVDERIYAANDSEYITTFKIPNDEHVYFQAFRLYSDGVLITEWGATRTPADFVDPLSGAPEGAKVVSYGWCVPTFEM